MHSSETKQSPSGATPPVKTSSQLGAGGSVRSQLRPRISSMQR